MRALFKCLTISVALLVGLAATPVLAALPPGGTFIDDDGNVHEGYIEAMALEGITKGCTEDRFCPEDPVTRGQVAAFLRRALGLAPSPSDHFVDDDASIFDGDIDAIADLGIVRGCNPPDNDRYCPDDPLTRGQIATFLWRLAGKPAAFAEGVTLPTSMRVAPG